MPIKNCECANCGYENCWEHSLKCDKCNVAICPFCDWTGYANLCKNCHREEE